MNSNNNGHKSSSFGSNFQPPFSASSQLLFEQSQPPPPPPPPPQSSQTIIQNRHMDFEYPKEDDALQSQQPELDKKKSKKNKKSKQHRFRHTLPGPAGVLQLASDSKSLLSSKHNKQKNFDPPQDAFQPQTSQQPQPQHKESLYSSVPVPVPVPPQHPHPDNVTLIESQTQSQHHHTTKPHLHQDQTSSMIGTIIHMQDHPAWKSMCIALERHVPLFSNCHLEQLFQHDPNNNHFPHIITQILQISLSKEYATLAEILAGQHDCFISKFVVVYITNVLLHSHCDVTCEFMDESGMRMTGWVHERFVKEQRQQRNDENVLKIGTVLLLKDVAITIFRKESEDGNGMEDEEVEYGGRNGGDMGNDGNDVLHSDKTGTGTDGGGNHDNNNNNNQNVKVNALERMLLIGEETVVCWWNASDAVNITYEEDIVLMKARNQMWDTISRNITTLESPISRNITTLESPISRNITTLESPISRNITTLESHPTKIENQSPKTVSRKKSINGSKSFIMESQSIWTNIDHGLEEDDDDNDDWIDNHTQTTKQSSLFSNLKSFDNIDFGDDDDDDDDEMY